MHRPSPLDVVVLAGTQASSAVEAAGLPTSGPAAIVVVRDPDGRLRDLDWVPNEDTTVEAVPMDSPDGIAVLRHSTAHLLAQAVQALFPAAKLGTGPAIENGFYYDFSVSEPFRPDDLRALEKKMRQIAKAGQTFRRREFTDTDEARAELIAEPFKLDLLQAKPADEDVMALDSDELTAYDNVDRSGQVVWSDLCRGPHLPSTRLIQAFKLTRTSAAYWRGSEKNPMLQRIYGTAWPDTDALQQHLDFLAEAERRDHRRLGVELDLFSFPDLLGSGLPVFHPKGGIIRHELQSYSWDRHKTSGYAFVSTPHIAKEQLFLTSGHLPYYADSMFPPMQFDGADYYLKAMNCPMHALIFRGRGRSYRELPLRLFEFGSVYRHEQSGAVHGLTRVRSMTQDDAHIFCTKEQMAEELKSLLAFVLDLLKDYGLSDFYLELSTRDDSPKFIGSDEEWAEATQALQSAAEQSGLELVPDPGGAAFYGPKISVQARDAIGRSWQMSTIQVDFQSPQRFNLEFQGPDGAKERPVVIHRALFGSVERFFGVLTEHYAGAFPAWLSPVQVVGIPIRGDEESGHTRHLERVVEELVTAGIRAEVDYSPERMQKKIRTAQQQKIPFMMIVGDQDVAADTVSFRYRDGSQRNGIPMQEAIEHVLDVVRRRQNSGPSVDG